MNYDEIKKLYEQSREQERVKIVKLLNDKGLKASTRIDAGKGRSDYTAGGTISPYDLTNWKYVDAKGDGYGVFVLLQAFDQDPHSKNHHVLMDRLGVYVYEKYNAEQAFRDCYITNIDLPLTDAKLDELYEVIMKLVSANVRNSDS